ncbi:sensor histidine kinase [Prauserella muralis]|uniref:histidine kinase n=1 Tax=Prauserella muralis TaxID=588067 RepID=A0A2V4B8B5_9PSEU|nr:histidine kinase [Prauserella muralis]PXY31490.1 histidine kinase [Prauserella muralis]TWE14163.1 histidine kinase [Prauserella muralis]
MNDGENTRDDTAYLGALTGVRSGKRSFYPEYVRSAERLQHAVQAIDRISRALVHTAEGPRAVVEAVVRAAAEYLQAEWLLFAVADGALPTARPRQLLLRGDVLLEDERRFPAEAADHLSVLRTRPQEAEDHPAGVAMTLGGEPVGGMAGRVAGGAAIAETDRAILRVLVNLAARNAELQQTQRQLIEAMQRQALDDERHRIARELHDSVTQDVLSAGITIEVCRSKVEGEGLTEIAAELTAAKDLTRRAVERLRAAIYALHHGADERPGSLPVLLERLSTVHLPSDVKVRVTVRGTPVPLPGATEHALLRITGEALFNIVTHTTATQAVVVLHYRTGRVTLTVSDDGDGDPAHLRRTLRLATATDLAGGHRGLANMLARVDELGGTLSIRRARIGGILLAVEVPVAAA